MEYKIQLRNPNTKEKTVLTAYNKSMALSMIKQSIKDGWRVKHTAKLEPLIKKLRDDHENSTVNNW